MKQPFQIKSIFLKPRFYLTCAIISLFFIAGYFFDPFFLMGKLLLMVALVIFMLDLSLLYYSKQERILCVREVPERFSNGDENPVTIHVKNLYPVPVFILVIDELPAEFQIRNFGLNAFLRSAEEKIFEYKLRPVKRGEYLFGRVHVFAATRIGFIERRFSFAENKTVKVYPSFLNLRRYSFLAFSNRLTEAGIKRIRRIGQHSEFDQIRDYVKGDDLRSINWKATAKKGHLMSNQYQDERSQQIFNVIDMGRTMKMPFEQLSLLDYAINASLVLSNTALIKHDKAGLITFNTGIQTFMPAERKNKTMVTMMETLYNQDTRFAESNYELLYVSIKRNITHRSLLILYTNYESVISLLRQIQHFQKIARNHLLLVVIFENTEIEALSRKEAVTLEEIYIQTIAEKFTYDKQLIVKELKKHGILSLLTHPHHLSVNIINKYLELKDRSLI